jgi:hypothetical protein
VFYGVGMCHGTVQVGIWSHERDGKAMKCRFFRTMLSVVPSAINSASFDHRGNFQQGTSTSLRHKPTHTFSCLSLFDVHRMMSLASFVLLSSFYPHVVFNCAHGFCTLRRIYQEPNPRGRQRFLEYRKCDAEKNSMNLLLLYLLQNTKQVW